MTPAQDALVSEHLRLLPAVAARLRLRPSASADRDDLMQAGALAVVQAAAGAYDPARGASFSTYAWRCVANAMVDEARAGTWKRRAGARDDRRLVSLEAPTDHDGDALVDPDAVDPAAVAVRADEAARVRQAVDELPPALAVVVRGYWFEGLEQKQIAAREGVAPSAISYRLRRAYRRLAAALADGGAAVGVAA